MTQTESEYLRELRRIAVQMAAFCARLSGYEGVPLDVAEEGMILCHGFKRVDSRKPVIVEVTNQGALS